MGCKFEILRFNTSKTHLSVLVFLNALFLMIKKKQHIQEFLPFNRDLIDTFENC